MISSRTFLCLRNEIAFLFPLRGVYRGQLSHLKKIYTISCETTLNFGLQLAKKRKMSKIISAQKDSRVWTRSFLAGNSFFGPYLGDVTQLIKRVQFPLTPSVQFKVSANAFLVNLATCFITF